MMKVFRWEKLFALILCAVLALPAVTSFADTMDIDVTKEWQDGNNADNTRPSSVSVDLLKGEEIQQTLAITPDDTGTWSGVISGVERYDGSGQEISYTLKEQPVSGYTTTVEQGEMVSTYEYPTNTSSVNPDKKETTTGTVYVTGSNQWKIQPGLRTDHIEATQIVFNTMNIQNATIKEYYPDGAPVPSNERVFWKNSRNAQKNDNGKGVSFVPIGSYGTGIIVSTDHYVELTFPGAVTILDGTSSGTTRDVVLTISNLNIARTKTRNFNGVLFSDSLWAGPGDSNHNMGGLSMDITFSVPGVENGDVLISFVDIDVTENNTVTGSGPRNESVSFVKGVYDTFYTVPLDSTNPTRVLRTNFGVTADGAMRAYARSTDASTLQGGMVARASLSNGGFTIRWTGSGCATELFTQVKPFRQKVTVDELAAGGNGGTITHQSDWVFRDYGEDEIITMTPNDGYHIKKITIDGNEIDLDGFDENGVMTVTTGWKDYNKGTETVTLYQRANGVVDVYLPSQYYAVNNTAPARSDHWIDVSYESNGVASTYTVRNVLNTQISGTKTWVRGTQNSPKSEDLVLNVTRNGEPYAIDAATQVSWDGDNWTISGLPKYDTDGKTYTYEVTEVVPAGYDVTYDPANPTHITNTLKQVLIEVVGRKVWKDGGRTHNNAQDLIVTLKRAKAYVADDGSIRYGSAEPLDWPIEWVENTYYFRNLPKYDDARYEYKYTVTEELSQSLLNSLDEGDAYTSRPDDTNRNFVNTLTGTTSFSGTKTWKNDGLTHDNATDLTLVLYWESETVSKKQTGGQYAVSWDGDTYTYTGLPKYDSEGYPYTYSVRESRVMGVATQNSDYNVYYDGKLWDFSSYSTPAEAYNVTGKDIINELPITDLSVTKIWDDDSNRDGVRPETLTLTVSGAPEGIVIPEPEITKDGNAWTYIWKGLPKTINKEPIEYTISEEAVPEGYTCEVATVGDKGTITNKHVIKTVDIPVMKVWEDEDNKDKIRPVSITVRLLADGEETKTASLTKDGGWKYTFGGLPAKKDGKAIEYTVTEDEVKDYTTEVSGSVEEGYTITNSYTPVTYKFSFTKIWANEPQDSIRWTQYSSDGTVTIQDFERTVLNKNEWLFEATVSDDGDYYIIEAVPSGYQVKYRNVGKHAGETDRCYNGGTIINTKRDVPKTGDTGNPLLWGGIALTGIISLAGIASFRRKRKEQQ